jgi:hypothetical protein
VYDLGINLARLGYNGPLTLLLGLAAPRARALPRLSEDRELASLADPLPILTRRVHAALCAVYLSRISSSGGNGCTGRLLIACSAPRRPTPMSARKSMIGAYMTRSIMSCSLSACGGLLPVTRHQEAVRPVGATSSGSRLATGRWHCQPPSRRSAGEAGDGSRW